MWVAKLKVCSQKTWVPNPNSTACLPCGHGPRLQSPQFPHYKNLGYDLFPMYITALRFIQDNLGKCCEF